MYTFAAKITAPVVGRDETTHQDCACIGLRVALPDGLLQLFADDPGELEALGWGILDAIEAARQEAVHLPDAEHTGAHHG